LIFAHVKSNTGANTWSPCHEVATLHGMILELSCQVKFIKLHISYEEHATIQYLPERWATEIKTKLEANW